MEELRQSIKDKNEVINNNELVKELYDNMVWLEKQSNKWFKEWLFDSMKKADLLRIEDIMDRFEGLYLEWKLTQEEFAKLDEYFYNKYKAKLNKRKNF